MGLAVDSWHVWTPIPAVVFARAYRPLTASIDMDPPSTPSTGKVMISPSPLLGADARSDREIARDAIAKLKLELPDSDEALKVTVENG